MMVITFPANDDDDDDGDDNADYRYQKKFTH